MKPGLSAPIVRLPLVRDQKSWLVCGARRPQDAGDEYSVRPSAQRHGPQALRHEGIPSPGWESSGVSHRPGASLQSDSISAPGPECRDVWRGSGRRGPADVRLAAQPANSHVRRLSVGTGTSQPLNWGECDAVKINLPVQTNGKC